MTRRERETLTVVVSELATALRFLLRVATHLRHTSAEVNDDVEKMDAAIDRAARTLKRLQLRKRGRSA